MRRGGGENRFSDWPRSDHPISLSGEGVAEVFMAVRLSVGAAFPGTERAAFGTASAPTCILFTPGESIVCFRHESS